MEWLGGWEHDSLRRACVVRLKRALPMPATAPCVAIPNVNELKEMHDMLAERVKTWTEEWKQRPRSGRSHPGRCFWRCQSMLPKPIEALRCGLALAILAVSQAGADEPALETLRERCQTAREARIAPLREAAIEDCISQPRTTRSREDCERMHRDFGMGGGTVGGGFRPPMFMDLPECIELREAEDRQARRGTSR